jgi:acyl-coenzyme A synthetase/AMP-(fatty) acid ligase
MRTSRSLRPMTADHPEKPRPRRLERAYRARTHSDRVAVVGVRHGRVQSELRDRLVEHVRARLAPFKVPARWFVADEMPVTPTGKVRKFELRDAILRDELSELR